jgi:hypothetical protein
MAPAFRIATAARFCWRVFGLYPFRLKLYADGGYQGPESRRALTKTLAHVTIEIVKRCDQAKACRLAQTLDR